eukprot:CAMPEP_0182568382 /NCGR_PEP_ID=MMETSP1324-20130603/9342_1 /TAXON_ID=236786 /ORGANISM="Florenciella sp., Strain RCC1587" /LENGTH=190 /DNA_ID=CAMNT_0024782517 /DNA_START=22 /DNA_END=594 /DNA_ORIENTATION=-
MMQDSMDDHPPSALDSFNAQLNSKVQQWLDWSTPHIMARWAVFGGLVCLYALRVWFINGWYIITYGLGIYLLNNFIGFLSPLADPESDGLDIPTTMGEAEDLSGKPFGRKLSEFKFWCASARAVCISFFMTFFEMFNIPVFWPILLLYFIALFVLTMKRQIKHMIKHKYVPWTGGKKKYKGGPAATKLSK